MRSQKPVEARTRRHQFMSGLITRIQIDKTRSRIEKLLFNPPSRPVYEAIQGRIMGVRGGINHRRRAGVRAGHKHGLLHLHSVQVHAGAIGRWTRYKTRWTTPGPCSATLQFRGCGRTYAARTQIDRPNSAICHASYCTPSFHCIGVLDSEFIILRAGFGTMKCG